MTAEKDFVYLKTKVEKVIEYCIDKTFPFIVETDASNHIIVANLNFSVALFSSRSELKDFSIEKDTQASMEALCKWKNYLMSRHFSLFTDHKSVEFVFDSKKARKI